MKVALQGRVITGPGWHLNAVMGPDGEIQLYDIFVENQWIGSRRTERQCIAAIQHAGKATPGWN
jgi:hypothetical protein